jgi:hypothetical protein
MRTYILTPAALVLLWPLASAAFSVADHRSLVVVNNSGLTLMELHAFSNGEEGWSDDLLHVHVLAPGEMRRFPLIGVHDQCNYDLWLTFEDGRERLETVDVCETSTLVLSELD